MVDEPAAVDFPGLTKTVSLKSVNFSYHDAQILHEVSFEIPAGKTMALVGRSGSGKTTITRMLSRLYDIDSGEIDYDGVSIKNIALHSLRENVAIVSQEVYMIDGSIRDNVRYGRVDVSDDDVWEVLKLADLDTFVHSIPDGLDTQSR